jgi:hypothetical protein
MKIQGFQSRGCGGGLWDAGWAIPSFIRINALKRRSFLGADTSAWYDTLTSSQQQNFLGRLQTLKD